MMMTKMRGMETGSGLSGLKEGRKGVTMKKSREFQSGGPAVLCLDGFGAYTDPYVESNVIEPCTHTHPQNNKCAQRLMKFN